MLQVLHLILCFPLFHVLVTELVLWVLWDGAVLLYVVLNAMPIFFFNKSVIFLIFGLWRVNVFQIFLSFLLVFLLTLCSICWLSLSSRCWRKLLFLAIDCIISHSICFCLDYYYKNLQKETPNTYLCERTSKRQQSSMPKNKECSHPLQN